MTELLAGTRKGLFVLEGAPGTDFEIVARAFEGDPVDYAMREPHSGRLFAAVTSPFWGPRIWFTDDHAGGAWQPATGVALPPGTYKLIVSTTGTIWHLTAEEYRLPG